MGAIVKGTIVPIHSEYLLNEYRGVLQRDRFRFDRNDVDILVGFLESTGISVEPEDKDYGLPDPRIPRYMQWQYHPWNTIRISSPATSGIS